MGPLSYSELLRYGRYASRYMRYGAYSENPFTAWMGLDLVSPLEGSIVSPYLATNFLPPAEDGRLKLRSSCASVKTLADPPYQLYPFRTAFNDYELAVVTWNATNHIVTVYDQTLTSLGSTSYAHTFTNWGPGISVTPFSGEGGVTRVIACSLQMPPQLWNGSSWATPTWTTENFNTAGQRPSFFAVTPWDQRLVASAFGTPATSGYNGYSVRFSEPGDPLNFKTNNFVDLEPGAGVPISGMATWRDYVFVFRGTSGPHSLGAFHVFYGTSTDSSGNPVFDYRTVRTRRGTYAGVAVAPEGVYFVDPTGIYLTTGDTPVEISAPIRPVFHPVQTDRSLAFTAATGVRLPISMLDVHTGALGSGTFSTDDWYFTSLEYNQNKLYFSGQQDIQIAGAAARRWTFVYNTITKQWSYYDRQFSSVKDFYDKTIVAEGGNSALYDLRQESSALPITSAAWRGAYDYFGGQQEKVIRQMAVDGTGQGIVVATIQPDTTDPAATGTLFDLAAAGSIQRNLLRQGTRGRKFQLQLAVTPHGADASARSVSLRPPHFYIRGVRTPPASEGE